MKESAWVGLIQRIPETQHDNLVAVTGTGAEIMVQKILILEDEFMIFRGRPAGSTDAPRILLMPFDQLNHLAFNKPLPEGEIKALFGSGTAAVCDAQAKPAAAVEQPTETAAPPEETPSPANFPKADPLPAKSVPSKSILLERLRARLSKG